MLIETILFYQPSSLPADFQIAHNFLPLTTTCTPSVPVPGPGKSTKFFDKCVSYTYCIHAMPYLNIS
jgi:hypothetical protein